ncbi:MAG TPA: protein hupE, partial [Rhizobiales bacterium]|nr:protein hupE [Hyphomicrobiales bacterium]
LSFCAGFAVATAILHAAGVGLGLGMSRLAGGALGRTLTRAAGALTALGGLWIAAGN